MVEFVFRIFSKYVLKSDIKLNIVRLVSKSFCNLSDTPQKKCLLLWAKITLQKTLTLMKPDSLIFDMDGTLWDAVDTYAHCWNIAFKSLGIDKELTGQDLVKYMGIEAKKIFTIIFPDFTDAQIDELFDKIVVTVDQHLPVMGGKLYPGVIDGLHELAKHYKLFMLSNCQKGSIGDFMTFTKTRELFIDYIEFGANQKPKHINMQALKDQYGLQSPMYVGDTDSDRVQSDMANVPFVFAAYGFGKTDSYALKFDSFDELTAYLVNL